MSDGAPPPNPSRSPGLSDEYWDVYARSAMPRETMTLCAIIATVGTGLGVAIIAFI
ncbi:hypothetical protein [Pseudoclavibacter sp. RFBA6]|uniref:hypothetical protein n=1 Tax=Pseudoclavibacter sp. RFBA6 TaxID=2080573 RepID=UPI0015E1DE56|nr:hypothetical protein [Pseudoclavibacter sp. RFBA6]